MRIISFLKWFLSVVILITLGVKLIDHASEEEIKYMRGYELFDSAEKALQDVNIEGAYSLFVQSSYELQDGEAKAIALYWAATIGWAGGLADYNSLVELYKQALRYHPGFDEAAHNLEFLYWLRANKQELPEPPKEPSRDWVTDGDV